MILIHNALIVPDGISEPYAGWLSVNGDSIEAMGQGTAPGAVMDTASEIVDACGAMLMPGAIDCHVHFREPGLTHKATIGSESAAAVAGGVTSYIEMPNTKPATVTLDDWQQKMEIAAADSQANYAFMLGATADNLQQLQRADYSAVPAVKVFLGSSTGNMLLDDTKVLSAVFADQPGRIVVHAEAQDIIDCLTVQYSPVADPCNMEWHSRLRPDECCVRATERAMELAVRYNKRLHVGHVTTRLETELLSPSLLPDGLISAEVSPHHLLFSTDDYAKLGSRIKMNPAVKSAADRDALRQALTDGRLDIVATDHAPHLLSEKQGDVFTAVSGAPMVQFSLVKTLDLFGPQTAALRMAHAPAVLFGIERRGKLAPGYFADMVLVQRLDCPHTITDADVVSKCGWTPLNGSQTNHRVVRTWVNGGCGAKALKFNA